MRHDVDREFLAKKWVAHRYGVSTRTVDRYLKHDGLNFPRPIYIGTRPFWRATDLEIWEMDCASARLSKEAA